MSTTERVADLLRRWDTQPAYRVCRFASGKSPPGIYWCDISDEWRTPYRHDGPARPTGPEAVTVGVARSGDEAQRVIAADMASRYGPAQPAPPTEMQHARIAGTDCVNTLAGAVHVTARGALGRIDAPTRLVSVSESIRGEVPAGIGDCRYDAVGTLIAEAALFAVESHAEHLIKSGTPRAEAEAEAAGERTEWDGDHDDFVAAMSRLNAGWGPLTDAASAEYTPCAWRYSAHAATPTKCPQA